MKTIIRETIARIPGLRYWVARWIFFRPENRHNVFRFLGVFKTRAEALAHIPAAWNAGADDPVPENYDPAIPERDAPVVRILGGLILEVRSIFDLGGSVGMGFYRYRAKMTYRPDLRWTVCDFPRVIEVGQRMARERGETQLFFTDKREEGSGTDVYLTCGALQFFEEPFADLLAKLNERPRHILVNRIPLTEQEAFYSLQHTTGDSVLPYNIRNVKEFTDGVEALGYKLVELWKVDRACDIILRPDKFVPNYYGAYFTLAR
jgi:putative methyltransferase (TIGR04325 family)